MAIAGLTDRLTHILGTACRVHYAKQAHRTFSISYCIG